MCVCSEDPYLFTLRPFRWIKISFSYSCSFIFFLAHTQVLGRYTGLQVSNQLDGQRVSEGEQLAYPYSNLYHSWSNAMHKSFVVRGRSFYKTDVDLSTLDLPGFNINATDTQGMATNLGLDPDAPFGIQTSGIFTNP